MTKKAHLRVEHLAKHFKQAQETIEIFADVSAIFTQGTTYAITGASGTGKSTFMHLVAGIEKPDAGAIYFNDNDINKLTNDERAVLLNQSIGVVFQQPYLIRELSVIENVYLPGLIANVPDYGCRDRALQLLERVGLTGKEDSAPSSLSGGQQQRVAIARALFNEPAFLLADEPTGSLDIKTGRAIVDLMVSCQREQGMGILVSTHDSYVAERMDIVLEFVNGNLVQRRP